MSLKPSIATANACANAIGLKEQFDNGFLYLFSGPVPDTASEALDVVTLHTEVVKISVDSDGVTGLDFDAPVGGVLSKAVAQDWTGTAAFDGFDELDPSLAPSFYRFCAAADNGRGVADGTTGYRIQGTVGGPSSGADLVLGSATIANAAVQPVGAFSWRVGPAP